MHASIQDFIGEFGEQETIALTDQALLGVVDETKLTKALGDATFEINRYLATRYPMPLPSTTPVLIRICCDLARYYLTGSSANETSPIVVRFKDARKDLADIRDGKTGLGLNAEDQPVADKKMVKARFNSKPVFSRGALGDY